MKILTPPRSRLFHSGSVIALLGTSVVTAVASQAASPPIDKISNATQLVCAPGKVPGYVSSGCVDDTAALGNQKKPVPAKGAIREPVQNMIGRGVPTVNINLTQTTNTQLR